MNVLGGAAALPERMRRDAAKHDRAPVPPQRAGRVLVVEDNVVNQKVASRLLQKIGYACDVVGNGLEALDALERKAYTLVLMDVQMPEMDGLEATVAIRAREENGTRLPIVAMTANAMEGERQRCLDHGMDDYISKPFRTQEVKEVLSRLIAEGNDEGTGGEASGDGEEQVLAAVDQEAIDGLRELIGDEEQFHEMIHLYLEDALCHIRTMREALAASDAPALERAAHQLKGSSGSFGTLGMVGLCQELETQACAGTLGEAPSRLRDLEAEYQRVQEALKTLL